MLPDKISRPLFSVCLLACLTFTNTLQAGVPHARTAGSIPKATTSLATRLESLLVPGHGLIQFQVPAGWKATVGHLPDENADLGPPEGLPPSITFSETRGRTFQVLVSPGWDLKTGNAQSDEAIEQAMHGMMESIQENAENRLELKALPSGGGVGNKGYTFFAVDPSPKPGEWKNMTQGIVRTGNVVLGFTVLTNPGQETIDAQAVEMLGHAIYVPET